MKTAEQNDTIQAPQNAPVFGHTPGPWHVERHNSHYEIWPKDMKHVHTNVGMARRAEDARLIAAAPELLEALQHAARYLEIHCDNPRTRNFINLELRAAIAKATGGQQ